ncbi:hypothetical protein [Croceicoccus sp. Ery15]|uniref:hypothetical protein n=1 Tax=Croceicoccus sp. Ery15 TaxID=1703338 RepID=UPI001E29A2F7|nr:hypothetical protein [Croceicoccus sp. Ery15]
MDLLTKVRACVKDAWKYWSVKFAALPAAIIAFFAASPDQMIAVAGMIAGIMPDGPLKWLVVALVGVASWALPTLLRMLPQPKLEQADGE